MVSCRVTIGTWNVAGTIPDEDLDIDDWISSEEPSDIYILGLVLCIFLDVLNLALSFSVSAQACVLPSPPEVASSCMS